MIPKLNNLDDDVQSGVDISINAENVSNSMAYDTPPNKGDSTFVRQGQFSCRTCSYMKNCPPRLDLQLASRILLKKSKVTDVRDLFSYVKEESRSFYESLFQSSETWKMKRRVKVMTDEEGNRVENMDVE
ncbi:hypothetical protein ANN_07781 [Periplaneta americana]|uniref:Uncharacterized protein n=1 Tax=Periplaneta americana TaxID=6978 RepID=A0ABQ8T0Y9_PERAM|nr:hypothetical protein ANN_07781 [Periplaneta americana]